MGKPIVIAFALAAMVALAGCAQGVGATKAKLQTDAEFNDVFVTDVERALGMARRTDDILAVQCWEYLQQFAIEVRPDSETELGGPVGPLSSYQKVRDLRRTIVEVEISDVFRLKCGPMLTDSAAALGRLRGKIVTLAIPGL